MFEVVSKRYPHHIFKFGDGWFAIFHFSEDRMRYLGRTDEIGYTKEAYDEGPPGVQQLFEALIERLELSKMAMDPERQQLVDEYNEYWERVVKHFKRR